MSWFLEKPIARYYVCKTCEYRAHKTIMLKLFDRPEVVLLQNFKV